MTISAAGAKAPTPAPAPRPTPAPTPRPAPNPTPPPDFAPSIRLAWTEPKSFRPDGGWDAKVSLGSTGPAAAVWNGWMSTWSFGGNRSTKPGNATETAIAGVFLDAARRGLSGLGDLRSNATPAQIETAAGRADQFALVVDNPGLENDLRFVGILNIAPKPIRDIIAAAKEAHAHL